MHILQFLKSGSCSAPGGKLNFTKNLKFDHLDLDLCRQRFHRNIVAEFNIWCNDSMEDVINPLSSIFVLKLGHAYRI